jgi:DNA invertase Pin-like site-specific DNA recombinase
MNYGYIRLSPLLDDLENQKKSFQHLHLDDLFIDDDRTEDRFFHLVCEKLMPGDTLIIASFKSIPLGPTDLLAQFKHLTNNGVNINIADSGVIDSSTIGDLIIKMLDKFIAYEKYRVTENTQAGKAKAKGEPNFKEGRPKKYSDDEIQRALDLLKQHSYRNVEEITGISVSTLTREKKKSRTNKRRS